MTADWVARMTAIGSGTFGLVSLGWNITAWRRQGPVVKVTATCSGRGDQMRMSGRRNSLGPVVAERWKNPRMIGST